MKQEGGPELEEEENEMVSGVANDSNEDAKQAIMDPAIRKLMRIVENARRNKTLRITWDGPMGVLGEKVLKRYIAKRGYSRKYNMKFFKDENYCIIEMEKVAEAVNFVGRIFSLKSGSHIINLRVTRTNSLDSGKNSEKDGSPYPSHMETGRIASETKKYTAQSSQSSFPTIPINIPKYVNQNGTRLRPIVSRVVLLAMLKPDVSDREYIEDVVAEVFGECEKNYPGVVEEISVNIHKKKREFEMEIDPEPDTTLSFGGMNNKGERNDSNKKKENAVYRAVVGNPQVPFAPAKYEGCLLILCKEPDDANKILELFCGRVFENRTIIGCKITENRYRYLKAFNK